MAFYNKVRDLLERNGLDPKCINDSAKGFVDYLSPEYKNRLIPLNAGFKNLDVSIISKADLLTMKICAWRESDMQDVTTIGISEEDLKIIKENIEHITSHSPDRAQKAQLVLTEIGVISVPKLNCEDVKTLTELIQFYCQKNSSNPSIDEIKRWKYEIASGLNASDLAVSLVKNKEKSSGLDI
jgi:hypothetical protein